MKKIILKISIAFVALIVMIGIILFALVWNGIIILNEGYSNRYDIKGVDVSSHQGEIDWGVIASQGVSFAFIKATEGSSFVDKSFEYNFKQAQKADISVGAYHFFSYDSGGITQAENFINTVIAFEGMLPPVIDVEFYGDKEKDPPEREQVSEQLKIMLELLEKHYGQKPIIYATERSYELYLANDYGEYDIWIRNVISRPKLSDNREWVFWQYTNRERLKGFNGKEKYIDVNVFNGDAYKYAEYLRDRTYKAQGSID